MRKQQRETPRSRVDGSEVRAGGGAVGHSGQYEAMSFKTGRFGEEELVMRSNTCPTSRPGDMRGMGEKQHPFGRTWGEAKFSEKC